MARRGAKKKYYYFDINFLFIVISLLVFGLLMIYSTSSYEANMEFGDAAFYFRKQLGATVVGLLFMILVAVIPYRVYRLDFLPEKLHRLPIYVAMFFLLLLFTPLAYSANGATRWLDLGVSVQPAEIAKLAVIVYLAAYTTRYPKAIQTAKGMLHFMFWPLVLAVMIYGLSSNLSSAIIVVGIAAVMLFVATPQYKRYILIVLAVLLVAAAVVAFVLNQDPATSQLGYRGDRIRAWVDPEAYADSKGYQTLQSLYAIGSGGFWGKGLGESVQKLGFIPEAQNDMIFSIICEELGLLGATVIIVLFIALLYRCLYIATNAKDLFGAMLVVGVMAHIAIQVILNIAVVTNTIPNTGISLPFISYGGSSVVFLLMEVGLVLGVARSIEMKDE